MSNEIVSPAFPYRSQFIEVDGAKIHYIEDGDGDPLLFLHGIPSSSYLWRNVIPYLAPLGRCVVPDLIGMGKSSKPAIEYSIFDHVHYIEQFIEALGLRNITFIMHGWGSIIGLDYAMRHQQNCKGLVFYESFIRPITSEDFSLPLQEQLMALQNQNAATFINTVFQQGCMRKLSAEEMRHYLEPLNNAEGEKLLKQYLDELPRGDGKSSADELIERYSKKLTHSELPKLMLYSIPGFITSIDTAMWAKDNLPNLELVDIGEEWHFAQESYPKLIGETISVWMQSIETDI